MAADMDMDMAADLVLASALAQVPAERITGWVMIAETGTGVFEVRTDGCCIHHAGVTLRDHVGPDMARLPPCTSSGR